MTRKEYARKRRAATARANKHAAKWRSAPLGAIVCPYSFELYADSMRGSLPLELATDKEDSL